MPAALLRCGAAILHDWAGVWRGGVDVLRDGAGNWRGGADISHDETGASHGGAAVCHDRVDVVGDWAVVSRHQVVGFESQAGIATVQSGVFRLPVVRSDHREAVCESPAVVSVLRVAVSSLRPPSFRDPEALFGAPMARFDGPASR